MPNSLVSEAQKKKGIKIIKDNNKMAVMHNKYVIIDDHTVMTGSFNWTRKLY